jgi:D-amino-acid oxidase
MAGANPAVSERSRPAPLPRYSEAVPASDPDVLVIGAGVTGLTTAICLAEAGASVRLVAAQPPRETTSVAAGALWGPHLVGLDDRIGRWSEVTLARLTELAGPDGGAPAGVVHLTGGIAATAIAGDEPPGYAAGTLTPCGPDEIPPGYVSAWRLSAPLVAMPEYLDYLAARLTAAGGQAAFGPQLASLGAARDLAPGARVIVNCAGYGARGLVPDSSVSAVRGQAVVVRNPGLTEFFVGSDAASWPLVYLFPHGDVVLLGGTEEPGNTSREPDPATAAQIIAACTAVAPQLRGAQVLGHRAGLRPVRPSVRLEAEARDGVTVVHSYGHGGAGVTLSWGCAQDACALALAALGAAAPASPDGPASDRVTGLR